MKAGRKSASLAAGVMIATGLMMAAAAACDGDAFYQVRYQTRKGDFTMTLNGAHLSHGGGATSGVQQIRNWLVKGQNVVRIRFYGEPGTVFGSFSMEEGCRGSFDYRVLERVSFDGTGWAELVFDNDEPVFGEFMNAEVRGRKGLIEAVETFQEAVRAGKIDDVIAMHQPMLRDYVREGTPIDRVKDHMRTMLGEQNAIFANDLTVKPIMGGRIYQVLDADHLPPFHVTRKAGPGTLTWSTGTYWGVFDGKWAIVAR